MRALLYLVGVFLPFVGGIAEILGGDTLTRFTHRIKSWHTSGAPPAKVMVGIWSSARGTTRWRQMWAYDPSDTNCKDGKWYTLSMRWLDSSAHACRFAARQGPNWAYWPQPQGSYRSGPTVGP